MSSSIAERLDADLKEGMRQRDAARVGCIRQLRSKAQEAAYAKGFSGPQDDSFFQKVIGAYVKQLQGGIEQLTGERGATLRDAYRAEIDYLSHFLPQQLDRAQTRDAVRAALDELQLTDPRQGGKALGLVMRRFPGQVDAALAREMVADLLR